MENYTLVSDKISGDRVMISSEFMVKLCTALPAIAARITQPYQLGSVAVVHSVYAAF